MQPKMWIMQIWTVSFRRKAYDAKGGKGIQHY